MINPCPRIAAFHDISGFGRASLTVAIPILSNMGFQVCPVPTAVLSSHSEFNDYYMVDFTEHLESYIAHWKRLNISFQSVYSGFLGSPGQIEIVRNFITDFKQNDQIIIVDPVLGDNGHLYSSIDTGMVDTMRDLVSCCDVMTPNLTEAALLLNKKPDREITLPELKEWLLELSELGPSGSGKKVVITSALLSRELNTTSVVAYDKTDSRYWKVDCTYVPAKYPGTGDAFTSVLTGSLLQGDSLPVAIDRAVQFVSAGIRATFGHNMNPKEGFLLEKALVYLRGPAQMFSYELL